ncbi:MULTISPECIES: hypothetical protein [Idiomarina]|uniref:hypothetical protein n=1 Tax=Idiomarina TaxID=135575 RepID=UPI001650E19D|nr:MULTISPECIES: hypothetical protein [Idiomarina]
MIITASIIIYSTAFLLWFVVWYGATGYTLMRTNKLLIFPWIICPLFLIGNLLMTIFFGDVGSTEYEEGRFTHLTDRASIAVQATASIVIVATIVYGMSIKRVPVHFIRFMVYTFICVLGLMAPVLWIPIESPEMFYILRHLQTVALNYGLFFCVAGIAILLKDLVTHGDVAISFDDHAATLANAPRDVVQKDERGNNEEK